MNPSFANLRRALVDLARSPEDQLAMFPGKNQAVAGLTSLFSQAYDEVDVSRSSVLSMEARQAIDELLWEISTPIMVGDSEGNVGCTDEYSRTSEEWIELRLRAAETLELLNCEPSCSD